MSDHVVVIGAGIAGVAAAWSARRAGREATLVSTNAGASALTSGAVDDAPWEAIVRAARVLGNATPSHAEPIAPDIAAFASDLGVWDLPETRRPWLATIAGRIRPARGRDRALLDLEPLHDAHVLVPRAERAGWDADAIAATLQADPFARARRIVFHAVDLPVLRFDDERRATDIDLAARHDDDARIDWLARRLCEGLASTSASAVLLGPWLGATASRAEALSRIVGVACGEALTGVGSPAGVRFEAARDRVLDAIGVRRVQGRATRVDVGARVAVSLAGRDEAIEADAVVLAIGGMIGGGVIYAPPERRGHAARVPFEISLTAPVVLSLGGAARMEIVASMQGPELDATAWPAGGRAGVLEAVGIRCDEGRAGDRIRAAGDAIAGRPRTVIEAVASGVVAGSH